LLEEAIVALINQGKRNYAIDLSALDYLYSDSMNKFFAINRRILDVNGRLALLSPRKEVRAILDKSGIANFLKIYENENELAQSSQEIIKQTVSINIHDLKAQGTAPRPPLSEFEDLRSEIGSALTADFERGPAETMTGPAGFARPQSFEPVPHPPTQEPYMPSRQAYAPPPPAYQEPATMQPAPASTPKMRETSSGFRPGESAGSATQPQRQGSGIEKDKPPFAPAQIKETRYRDFFEEETKKKNFPVGIVFALIAVIILAGVGGWLYLNGMPPFLAQKSEPSQPLVKSLAAVPQPEQVVPQVAVEEPQQAVVEKQVESAPKGREPEQKRREPFEKKPVVKSSSRSTPKNSYAPGSPTQAEIDAARRRAMEAAAQEQDVEAEIAATEQAAAAQAAAESAAAERMAAERVAEESEVQPPVMDIPSDNISVGGGDGGAGDPGTIFIATIPPVAEVYMDGKLIGKSNVDELNVTSGTHMIKFVKSGKEIMKELTFKAGKNPSQMIKIQ
jgi:anti-anti-sigma regulatory factor